MTIDYFEGLFIIVNTMIAFYIVIYALIFLKKTKNYPDRRPWEFLFAGAVLFAISQVLVLLSAYGSVNVMGLSTLKLQTVMIFLYATLILLAFITQSHLILLSDMILITKKVEERRNEIKIEKPKSEKK